MFLVHHHHHHHHHHHLFLKRPILPRLASVKLLPDMKPLHLSLNTAHSGCKPSTFISSPSHIHTKSSSLYPHISPRHHHTSTGWHPIIPTLTFHMPKPPQSILPHHLSHALYTQKTVQIHTAFPILQRHSAHPSHHHPFHPLQQGRCHRGMGGKNPPTSWDWGNKGGQILN